MDENVAGKLDLKAALQNATWHPTTSFVSNPIQIESRLLPFKFPDGSVLDRATPAEREIIKSRLALLISKTAAALTVIFECDSIATEIPTGGYSFRTEPLPEPEWKYFVVRFADPRRVNVDLHYAASVCQTPLDLLAFHFTDISHGWRSEELQKYFKIGFQPKQLSLDINSLTEIASTYDLLISTVGNLGDKCNFPELRRALYMLDSLNRLPPDSSFLCLGLFAIIEMLITHNPALEDRGDSITHQMKSKIPLLSRRFDRPLPLSDYFGNATSEKIWSALYSYRSSVAHGGVPDFKKKHCVLVSQENADDFLNVAVKSLIRHALREPYLYSDLRDC